MKSLREIFLLNHDPLREKSAEMYEEIRRSAQQYFKNCQKKDFDLAKLNIEKIKHLTEILHITDILIETNKNKKNHNGKPLFVAGTKFLYECFEYLTSMGNNEVFHYITGIQMGNVNILDNMQKVSLKRQSPCGAETDERSTAQSILRLEKFGHRLLATAHSHPASFSKESSTDKQDMQELHNGGHKIIGLIFTMDGYLRFYSAIPFEVMIYGKGVKKIYENLYKLTEAN